MKSELRVAVFFGIVLNLLCPSAQADDTVAKGPVITKLSRKKALNDMALELYGKNFGSDASKVKVTIDGRPCMLTFVSDKTIMLLTPSKTKIGETTLLLTVNNAKSNPMVIEILDRAKLGDDFWKRETERMEKSAREEEEKKDADLITLTQLTTKPAEGGRYFVEVKGTAKELIDNCRVQVQLSFMGQGLGKKYSKIVANEFSCQFGPFRKDLFPGIYEINAYFRLHRQRYRVRYEWKKVINKERTKKLAKLRGREFYNVGTKALARTKTAEVLKLRQELLGKLELQLNELQNIYASATRCYFRKNRKLDEARWKKWLERFKFVKNTEDWERILKDERVTRGGIHLDAVKWQSVISKQLRNIRTIYSDFDKSRTEFHSPRFPKLNSHLSEMFAVLFDLYVTRTVGLFKENRLRIPGDLVSQFGSMPFSQTPFTGVGRFKTLKTKVLQRIEEEQLAFKALEKANKEAPKKSD